MGKKKFLKKGVAYLLSAAMVLTGPWYTGGGIKADAAQPADIT